MPCLDEVLGNCSANVLLLQDYFSQINNRIVELYPVISLASSVFLRFSYTLQSMLGNLVKSSLNNKDFACQKGHWSCLLVFGKIPLNANLNKPRVHMEASSSSHDVYLIQVIDIKFSCPLVSLMVRPIMQSCTVSEFTHSLRGFPRVHR